MRSPSLSRRYVPAAALVLVGLAGAVHAQTTLTASSWLAPGHTLSETQKAWCGMLEQKTAGKVKCNILPRAVAAPPGTFDAVRNGLADLSYTVQGYTPGRFVTTQMAEVAFLGNSSESTSVALHSISSAEAAPDRQKALASTSIETKAFILSPPFGA